MARASRTWPTPSAGRSESRAGPFARARPRTSSGPARSVGPRRAWRTSRSCSTTRTGCCRSTTRCSSWAAGCTAPARTTTCSIASGFACGTSSTCSTGRISPTTHSCSSARAWSTRPSPCGPRSAARCSKRSPVFAGTSDVAARRRSSWPNRSRTSPGSRTSWPSSARRRGGSRPRPSNRPRASARATSWRPHCCWRPTPGGSRPARAPGIPRIFVQRGRPKRTQRCRSSRQPRRPLPGWPTSWVPDQSSRRSGGRRSTLPRLR